MSYPDTQLFINGIWKPAASGKTIPVIDPATAQPIGTVAHAEIPDLDEALAAAKAGFARWKTSSPMERFQVMNKAAALLRERAEEVAVWMTAEQGKPVAQSKMELLGAADTIEWFAGEARRTYGQVIPARNPSVTQITIKEAVGPVAAFTPWNFPVNQVVRKVSAALAAGCSIIVKAPEETPASPAALIKCFADAGLPDGVLNLVYGVPAEISGYLIPHPLIKKISFTGSTPVGKMLAGLAGQHMKKSTMELGGHAPVLVFDDADVDAAVSVMATSKFRNAGQVCVSPTRFLLQDGIAEQFTDGFVAAAKALKVGPGSEAGVDMGPLANDRRIPAMEELIGDAVARGATLATGGKRIGNEGWFFEPTVLTDVPTDARIMNEEPFGPVAILNKFSQDDEAFEEANRLPFGLAAYAWTTSSERSQRIRAEVQAGMVTVNHNGLALPEVPFGGILDSGMGTEGGSEAIEAYLQTRFVTQLG
ncbi:NAD-dependent succinate-semialdehyde dehydrogenase [Pseudooceanicola sp. CBS1P-1]|uniref:Aldehyde dehydrogenase family protein n=1 Tax=Pseudooceanicola albus TaxID=2692189 RepID=A0A6L7G8B0_9RHOB|nr:MULTISPECIES: NAD-dependent succinate-semialdehyde dehydrogenase [Pseudooceanicola]MBT9385678.1 NAD-dependent succinate-semialdehyde dehydrogenase [Pseudooceanicola endophyticus]MXN18913.1 aldehyde dehydrogenase family protein [Pseudooceanicola albus]